ncbi:MAG: hypothetical protein Q9190_004000 [Brigantiaea leucoxantha]
MTSDLPAEAPRFRGKTLTPESPVPLHVPEPSHIPVLQNQIDPIFNLTSTHMETSFARWTHVESIPRLLNHPAESVPNNTETGDINTNGAGSMGASLDLQSDQGDRDYVMTFENEDLAEEQDTDTFPNHSSSPADQISAPTTAYETLPSSAHNDASSLSLIQSPKKSHQSPPANSNSHQPSQDALNSHDQVVVPALESEDDADDQAQESGVNYQTLLDNLSPSTAAAPSAENITSITTAAPSADSNTSRPSSAEAPISALPLPPGLPPRPPPQEKPAIHPHYTAEEDIRSYHYPHIPNANSHNANTPQSNGSYRPSPGNSRPPPPNTSIGSNGLPPPPVATFQQPSQQPSQAQSSPVVSQSRQPDDSTKKNAKSPGSVEGAEGEAPWTPEVEKLYIDFLNEEAVYVAEGQWDRFPPGSRLFVGKIQNTEKS